MQLCDRSTLQKLCMYHSAADIDTGEANVLHQSCSMRSLSTYLDTILHSVPFYTLQSVSAMQLLDIVHVLNSSEAWQPSSPHVQYSSTKAYTSLKGGISYHICRMATQPLSECTSVLTPLRPSLPELPSAWGAKRDHLVRCNAATWHRCLGCATTSCR